MKMITIRGIDFQRPSEIHEFLEQELSFPEYYGRNLDALYDVLTDISEETEISIDMNDMEDNALREYLARLTRVCEDAAKANDSIKVNIGVRPPKGV